MASFISPQSSVDPRAEIGDDVYIGPFCVVGPHARIGAGTQLDNNVTISGHVELGENNRLFPGVVIGGEPQDLGYRGEPTKVVIGDGNVFREAVTVNRASTKERGVTTVGSNNFFMAGSHVAHDCNVGSHVVLTNATLLGGHVHVHDRAILAGAVGVHQFTTIGSYSFVGAHVRVLQDVPPFMMVDGTPPRVRCINLVGLKRQGFTPEAIASLQEAHRLLFRLRVGVTKCRETLLEHGRLIPETLHLCDFIEKRYTERHGRSRQQLRSKEGPMAA